MQTRDYELLLASQQAHKISAAEKKIQRQQVKNRYHKALRASTFHPDREEAKNGSDDNDDDPDTNDSGD